jgi:hypothetical protein
MKHSKVVGGSTAKRVMACPGSVALVQRMPPQLESSYAAEGTFLHSCMEQILSDPDAPPTLTEEQAFKTNFCLAALNEIDPKEQLVYTQEKKVEFEGVKGLEGVFGNVDLIGRLGKRAIVLDWKFGDGVIVDAEENEQGLFYAAAAMKTEGLQWVFEDATEVEIIIVQPPAVRRWVTTFARLEQFTRDLQAAVKQAKSDDAPTAMGDHCRWCTAKPICPQMNGAVDRALRTKLSAINIAPAMANIPLLEAWIAETKSIALRMLEDNVPVPGFKLVPKRASRVWVDEQKARDYLLVQGLQESEITELRSVAQIEKVLKKRKIEMPEIVSVSSGNTIAPESDPRSAVLNLGAALSKLR